MDQQLVRCINPQTNRVKHLSKHIAENPIRMKQIGFVIEDPVYEKAQSEAATKEVIVENFGYTVKAENGEVKVIPPAVSLVAEPREFLAEAAEAKAEEPKKRGRKPKN